MTMYYHVYTDTTMKKKLCVHYDKETAKAIAKAHNGIVVEKPYLSPREKVEIACSAKGEKR